MHRRTQLLRSALVFAALAVAAAGCGDDGSDGAPPTTEAAPTTTGSTSPITEPEGPTTTDGDTPATTPETTGRGDVTTTSSGGAPPVGDPVVIDAFVELRSEHCTGPTPEPIGTEVDEDGRVLLVDNEGNRLVVDVDEGIVTGLDGPKGELPPGYSYGCDPEVFVGTLPN